MFIKKPITINILYLYGDIELWNDGSLSIIVNISQVILSPLKILIPGTNDSIEIIIFWDSCIILRMIYTQQENNSEYNLNTNEKLAL